MVKLGVNNRFINKTAYDKECIKRERYKRRGTEVVEGAGFEPAKAEPSDLQSDPFGRSGTPPLQCGHNSKKLI
ncbi:putative orphan protein [Pseudoalteromonas tunicata D2]|uniref:Putative orphan protein n=1 Tax=Pseudoalteromonas tunicata D2 TaxID=87626 RepID=A4CBU1_9GAMM|nr:putative orphan protein [Pseudoalteromonas tunicata D2]